MIYRYDISIISCMIWSYLKILDKTNKFTYLNRQVGSNFNVFDMDYVKSKNIINVSIYGILSFSVVYPTQYTIYKTKSPILFKEAQVLFVQFCFLKLSKQIYMFAASIWGLSFLPFQSTPTYIRLILPRFSGALALEGTMTKCTQYFSVNGLTFWPFVIILTVKHLSGGWRHRF